MFCTPQPLITLYPVQVRLLTVPYLWLGAEGAGFLWSYVRLYVYTAIVRYPVVLLVIEGNVGVVVRYVHYILYIRSGLGKLTAVVEMF